LQTLSFRIQDEEVKAKDTFLSDSDLQKVGQALSHANKRPLKKRMFENAVAESEVESHKKASPKRS
jgi:hypothetical protein